MTEVDLVQANRGAITAIRVVRNPDQLAYVDHQLAPGQAGQA